MNPCKSVWDLLTFNEWIRPLERKSHLSKASGFFACSKEFFSLNDKGFAIELGDMSSFSDVGAGNFCECSEFSSRRIVDKM